MSVFLVFYFFIFHQMSCYSSPLFLFFYPLIVLSRWHLHQQHFSLVNCGFLRRSHTVQYVLSCNILRSHFICCTVPLFCLFVLVCGLPLVLIRVGRLCFPWGISLVCRQKDSVFQMLVLLTPLPCVILGLRGILRIRKGEGGRSLLFHRRGSFFACYFSELDNKRC